MKRAFAWLCSLSLLLAPAAEARLTPSVCGTYRGNHQEDLHLHGRSMRVRAFRAVTREAAAAEARDIGDIAVLSDADGVVARQNPFNLLGRTVRFDPTAASGYRYTTSGASYNETDASAGAPLTGMDDDDSRRVALPFPFPFYGVSYTGIWVNSDGNITFGTSDVETSARTLGRFTSGPPRIAPLFADLDPTQTAASIRVLAEDGRVVISWVDVPEYSTFGVGARQTFQVRIFASGGIELAWLRGGTSTAVTGLAPGALQGATSLVDFATTASLEYTGAIAERFGDSEGIDLVLAAQKFYETHEDAYDYLVFFNTLGIGAAPGAIASTSPLRVPFKGIGDEQRDFGANYGSGYRLQAVMNMGPLTQYPADPYQPVGGRGRITGDNTMTLLGHEAGHLWLALVSVRDAGNPTARPMLGTANAHWSFNFNSEASLLEGNRIRDDGAAARPQFTTTATVEGYSPLDQYLMGLRSPAEVPPTFLVRNSFFPNGRFPQVGVGFFTGERRDITIEEIIAAEGRRTPDSSVSPANFRFAFIVVTEAGADPPAEAIAKLDTYRREFITYFRRATGERASADTSLRRSLRLSLWPAGGVLAGGAATASVLLAKPAERDLDVQIAAPNGVAQAPSLVTVRSGEREAKFTVSGVRPGVEDITATAADTQYEVARARVAVAASSSALRLAATSGDRQTASPGVPLPQEIVIRALDGNDVPFASQPVQANVTGGGSVSAASGFTNAFGEFRVRWTPGAGPRNELRFELTGNPAAAVTVRAFGAPAASANGAVNAASFLTGVSPGSFASLFGANLSGGAPFTVAAPPYPTVLERVRLSINGVPMQIYAFNDDQINFLTPPDLAAGPADLVVETALGISAPLRITIAEPQPGIFFNAGNGLAAVRRNGRFVEMYGTGFGPLRLNAAGLEETVVPVEVTVGGLPARVLFSGLSPGTPGLHQINIEIPAALAPGVYPMTARQGGAVSNEVKLEVR